MSSIHGLSTHHAVSFERQREMASCKLEHLVELPSDQGCWDVTPCHCIVCSAISKERCVFILRAVCDASSLEHEGATFLRNVGID